MPTIAFCGGSSLCELGPREDVVAFFHCLREFAALGDPGSDYSLLDRLYRRCLRLEDLGPASELMLRVKAKFAQIPTKEIVWPRLAVGVGSRLQIGKPTLADVFGTYFALFEHCVESARINYETFKAYPGYRYEPVRIVIADQPWFLAERSLTADDYENVVGTPIWLQG